MYTIEEDRTVDPIYVVDAGAKVEHYKTDIIRALLVDAKPRAAHGRDALILLCARFLRGGRRTLRRVSHPQGVNGAARATSV